MSYPLAVYGHGAHDMVMRELEVGQRAAAYEDSEACGWSALLDIVYEQYLQDEQAREIDDDRMGRRTGQAAVPGPAPIQECQAVQG